MCIILCCALLILMLTMSILYIVSIARGDDNLISLYLIAIPVCGNALMLDYVNTTAQGDNHIGRIAIARCVPFSIYFIVAYFVFKLFGASPELMLLMYNGIAVIILSLVIGFNVYLGSLIAVSTQYLAGIALGHFCDDNSNVGFYTLALTLATPLTMLPSIIGTTYFKEFASSNHISKRILFSSLGLTLLSFLLFIIAIQYVVSFLYNESYSAVGIYASFIAIGTSFHGLGDMLNRFLGAHAKGKEIRNGALACGIMAVFGNVVFVYLWGIYGAIATRILSSMTYFIAMFYFYIRFSKKHE